MIVYFNNDGSYGQDAINIPVLANNMPIGFVSKVTEEQVTCYLWDRFIEKEQFGINAFSREQNICSIGIKL